MWILIYSYMHGKFNGISHLNSLTNSQDIAISVGWADRPTHHDIKYMNSQKYHWTGNFLIFLYHLSSWHKELVKKSLKQPKILPFFHKICANKKRPKWDLFLCKINSFPAKMTIFLAATTFFQQFFGPWPLWENYKIWKKL